MYPFNSYDAHEAPADGETPSETWARLYRKSMPARERAEINAALTMPEVYPTDGQNPDDVSGQTAFQSVGYRGMNNFVNVMANILFRTSKSFFRLVPSKKGIEQWQKAQGDVDIQDIEATLMQWEQEATDAWIRRGDHDKLIQALAHIGIIGQAVLWWDKPNDTFRVIPFQNYCIDRLSDGSIGTLIIAEQLRPIDLSKKLQDAILADGMKKLHDTVILYTRCQYQQNRKYLVEVSVDGEPVDPTFTKTYKPEALPFAAPFWSRVPEASYAISLADGLRGDLHKLNMLSAAQARGAVNLLNWRTLVNPGGITDIDEFNDTEPGEAVPGKPEDIAISSTGDPRIIELITSINDQIERRLSSAFLMEVGTFRQGERVTAEEVRRTVDALERQYTGIYAALSHHFQLPLARWLMDMAGLTLDDTLDAAIVTGLDALSRSTEAANLRMALLDLAGYASLPEGVLGRIKWEEVADAVGAGHGVNLRKFLIPEEEYQQQLQQQQAQQLAMQAAAQQAASQPIPGQEPQTGP